MYSPCKKATANIKLVDKLMVSPETLTVYGELCLLDYRIAYWTTESGNFWIEAAIDCGQSVTER